MQASLLLVLALVPLAYCGPTQFNTEVGQDQLLTYLMQRGDVFDEKTEEPTDDELERVVASTFFGIDSFKNCDPKKLHVALKADSTASLDITDAAKNESESLDVTSSVDGDIGIKIEKGRGRSRVAVGFNMTTITSTKTSNGTYPATDNIEGGFVVTVHQERRGVRATSEGRVVRTITSGDSYRNEVSKTVKASSNVKHRRRGDDHHDHHHGHNEVDRHHHRDSTRVDSVGESDVRTSVTVGKKTSKARARSYGSSISYVTVE